MSSPWIVSSELLPPGELEKVLKALQNPSWDWRTVSGIATEAGLPEMRVRHYLDVLAHSLQRGRTKDKRDVYRLVKQPSEKALTWNFITKSSGSSST